MKAIALTLILLTSFQSSYLFAQGSSGSIRGVLTEANGKPALYFDVAVWQNGNLLGGTTTDQDGMFEIRNLSPGTYDLQFSAMGYNKLHINGVKVSANITTVLPRKNTVVSIATFDIPVIEIIYYKREIFTKSPISGTELTPEELEKVAVRDIRGLLLTMNKVHGKDDGSNTLSINGMRSTSNITMLEGMKISGMTNIPQTGAGSFALYAGGIPARYGDVTGGVINITIKNPSREMAGSIEAMSSGISLGKDRYAGLDPYGYNLIEFSLSGPLFYRYKADIKRGTIHPDSAPSPKLGFFMAGNITGERDSRPSVIGAYKVKDGVLDELRENPLRTGFSENSVLPQSDFLRLSDFEKVKVRPNTDRQGTNLLGKVTYTMNNNANIAMGGNLNFQKSKAYDFDHSLFDFENYPEQTNAEWRVFTRFTKSFTAKEELDSTKAVRFESASFNIQVDYSRDFFGRQSAVFKDDFFNYGYIGKFTTYQGADFAQGQDSATGLFGNIQQTFKDTLVTFVPGTANPELARYTQRYYELNGWEGFDAEGNPVFDRNRMDALANYNNIQGGGGLINGDNLDGLGRSVYGMWAYNNDPTNLRGGMTDNYLQQVQEQFRITGQGLVDLGLHNLIVGFEFEQRTERAYSLNPRSLWTVARLRANNHIAQLDKDNPTVSYPGPYITYDRLNAAPGPYSAGDEQAFIDYNLRRAIGLDPDGTDYLDVNAIDPSVYSLDFFSADELYNGGSSLVNHYGYDPFGRRVDGNTTFDDFFTQRDAYGNLERPIAPFRPIYVAGYIEDEFAFDDLIFNIGLRVDRYDANQQVLIDPYVLFPTVRAGDDMVAELLPEGSSRPANIGDDFVVYTDNATNPTIVTGYRNENTWYNAQGAELGDASALRVANGLPAPLLVDPTKTNGVNITSESFEDYDPQVNFMPRIAFSFPISDLAKFYAHYDVLTMRPTVGNRLDPSDYYYLESRAGSGELNNPNLKPERTIDYEIGFDQLLTKSSALKVSAFYRESRDMIQVVRVFDAYPMEYRTFANIDFSTVKGLSTSYELLATGNLSLRASYTLQFAEGTGSNATSQLNLARSGEPNLRAPMRLTNDQRHQVVANVDYRFGDEKYNGPLFRKRVKVLKNTGANLTVRGGSGEPYNPQANFTSAALYNNNPAPLQVGSINGATLPWKFRFDLRLDKQLGNVRKDSSKHALDMNVYVQVLNLFNTRNINRVYRATGNPDDDGYLSSPAGKAFTASQNSPGSFMDYYSMKLMDPSNWELPRRLRFGVKMSF